MKEAEMIERRWISPKSASLYLGVHLQTVYTWIDNGRIPAAKLGRSVRVDRRSLDKMLEERLNGALGRTLGRLKASKCG